jgi:endonuclease YncB( thermonuclease family)
VVGLCRVEGVDLAAAQVEAGHALDEPRYSRGEYADEQSIARAARRGIWAGDFVTPAEWKKGRRSSSDSNMRRANRPLYYRQRNRVNISGASAGVR